MRPATPQTNWPRDVRPRDVRPRAVRWRCLVAGLALASALGGCTVPGLSSESSAGSTGAASPGPTWFRYVPGDPTGTRSTPAAAYRRSTRPSSRFPATATPVVRCTGKALSPVKIAKLDARPGTGSAMVSWWHQPDAYLLTYRVAAVAQDGPASASRRQWTDVPVPAGCQQLSFTVGNLRSGGTYVFWLDMVRQSPVRGMREPMVGRSAPVRIG